MSTKLKRKERKVFRRSFYLVLATQLEGPAGRHILQVLAERLAESPEQHALFVEYANDLMVEVVDGYKALANRPENAPATQHAGAAPDDEAEDMPGL